MSIHSDIGTKPHKHPNYLAVFIALGVLTATLTAIELMHQSGIILWPRASLITVYLSISVFKAVLVAMFYMHLKTDSVLYTILFGIPVLFAVFFFTMVLI